MDPWRHIIRRNSYIDILLAASIIARCAIGECRFMTLYNHFLIVGLVRNFTTSIPAPFMEECNASILREMQSDAFRTCNSSSFSRISARFLAAFQHLQQNANLRQLLLDWVKKEALLSTLFSCTIVPIYQSGCQWIHPMDSAIIAAFIKLLQYACLASSSIGGNECDDNDSAFDNLMTVIDLLHQLVPYSLSNRNSTSLLGLSRSS